MILGQENKPSLEDLVVHFGVKGMHWGVRKNYKAYQNRVFNATPGASKTSVTTKTGEKISVVKEKPGPIALAAAKLTGRKLADNISSMSIVDSGGKKVGSFQIWREPGGVVRGEWLQVNKNAQGRGYSKAAIEGLMKAAKTDKRVKEVRLQVPSEAAAAKHIYTSLGFKKDKDLGDTPTFGNIEDWVYKVK